MESLGPSVTNVVMIETIRSATSVVVTSLPPPEELPWKVLRTLEEIVEDVVSSRELEADTAEVKTLVRTIFVSRVNTILRRESRVETPMTTALEPDLASTLSVLIPSTAQLTILTKMVMNRETMI